MFFLQDKFLRDAKKFAEAGRLLKLFSFYLSAIFYGFKIFPYCAMIFATASETFSGSAETVFAGVAAPIL